MDCFIIAGWMHIFGLGIWEQRPKGNPGAYGIAELSIGRAKMYLYLGCLAAP